MSATTIESAALAASPAARRSSTARWAGRILSGLAVLFLAFDAAIKIAISKEALEGTVQLGYQAHHLPIIGTIAVVCLILYVIPRTAPLGAILWTGYLGGAIATHLRVDNPLFTHTLFPIYVAAFVWGGLYLRDDRVRALLRPAR
jgi:hypothetical protein